jgi:hypothetical protein
MRISGSKNSLTNTGLSYTFWCQLLKAFKAESFFWSDGTRRCMREVFEGDFMLTKKTLLVVICSLVFPACPLLHGQATGSFFGTVSDKTGSVITGAAVRATAEGTGLTRESKTDPTGHYIIPLLPISDYTIRVEAQGFGG